MNTQAIRTRLMPPRRRLQTLRGDWIMPLGASGGTLEVLHGPVWLTRAGDPDDHIVKSGETLTIPASGRALVQAWDDARPALIAWQPTPVGDRIGAGMRSAFGRCWDIVDPLRRVGVGTVAVVVALSVGAFLFGPLSEARSRALAAPAVLHNSVGARTSIGLDAGTRTGSRNDVSADARERARSPAQEARRRAPRPA